MLHLKRARK